MGDLLRFATAGSVDDGKSTLIGRLLHDSKTLFEDQLEAVARTSEQRGHVGVDLALITDGLRAEREQGITIDVAYRYFATPRRTFIIADTPGHAQYTRNMVTGASTADLAVILLDARAGIVTQTRRHAAIAGMLGIRRVVLAVNKMDLVDWSEQRFDELAEEFACFADPLGFVEIRPIPMSAFLGDNVVEPSASLLWYAGPTLLDHLETVPIEPPGSCGEAAADSAGARLAVQWVIRPRPGAAQDGRRYAGTIASGRFAAGDPVVVLPGGQRTTIAGVEIADGTLSEAFAPAAVSLRLTDDIDVGRGDLIATASDQPLETRAVNATVCWFSERPLRPGARVAIRHTTRTVKAVATALVDRLDVTNLHRDLAPSELVMNDLGTVTFTLAGSLAVDPYNTNRATGSFVVVDESTNETIGAGLVA